MIAAICKKPKTPVILILILIGSCTTTVRKTKDPEFAVPVDSVQNQMNQLVACEHVNVSGEEVTTNGKVSSNLEIDIINGKDIPTVEAQMKTLGRSIAAGLKNDLKNKKEYDTYQVLFVKVDSSSAMTKRTWTGFTYKPADL